MSSSCEEQPLIFPRIDYGSADPHCMLVKLSATLSLLEADHVFLVVIARFRDRILQTMRSTAFVLLSFTYVLCSHSITAVTTSYSITQPS